MVSAPTNQLVPLNSVLNYTVPNPYDVENNTIITIATFGPSNVPIPSFITFDQASLTYTIAPTTY